VALRVPAKLLSDQKQLHWRVIDRLAPLSKGAVNQLLNHTYHLHPDLTWIARVETECSAWVSQGHFHLLSSLPPIYRDATKPRPSSDEPTSSGTAIGVP